MIFSTTMNCPQPGRYEFLWNGTDIAGRKVGSSIYFAILKRENRRFINKMALLK